MVPIFLLLLGLFPLFADGGRILVGYAPDTKSHLLSILPFAKKLADAGHQVSVLHVYTNATGTKKILDGEPNIRAIDLELTWVPAKEMKAERKLAWHSTLRGYLMPFAYYYIGVATFDLIVNNGSTQLTEILNTDWDFVVTCELFSVHAYALTSELHKRSHVPYAVIGSTALLASVSYRTDLANNWVTRPAMFGSLPAANVRKGYDPEDFSSRLESVLDSLGEVVAMSLFTAHFLPPTVRKLTGAGDYDHTEFVRQSSVYFTDSIEQYMALPDATVPELKYAGAHCEVAKPLTGDYAAFVEDRHSLGTIYIAFGISVPWDQAPEQARQSFFTALARLTDYRVIFAYDGDISKVQDRLASHVKLVKWAPQLDVLAHPKTKVFLTHGGLKSMRESLCTATPMLVMPMFAEQSHNAKMLLEWGLGRVLNKYHLTAEGVERSLRELLLNPRYEQRAVKLRSMLLDRPVPALDEAEFYVSRLIAMRQRGNEGSKTMAPKVFFDRPGKRLATWHYWNMDVLSVVAVACIALAMK